MNANESKIKAFSLITTIFCGVVTVSSLLSSIYYLFIGNKVIGFIGNMFGFITDIDKNSPSAGYEFIFRLFGSLFGGIAGFFILALGVIFAISFVNYLIPFIVGIVSRRNANKNSTLSPYKADGIVKIVFNSIPAIVTILIGLSGLNIVGFIFAFVFVAVIVLSAMQIYYVK